MMPTTRSASSVQLNFLCLLLTYALLLSLFAPFTVSAIEAAPVGAGKPSASPASTLTKKARHREGELLIRFRQSASEQDRNILVASKGARRDKKLAGKSRFEKLRLAAGRDLQSLAAELRQNPMVEIAEPNYLVERDEIVPDDPQFDKQWALRNTGQNGGQVTADLGAAQAWETTTGSPSTLIAVIDSGIDFTHPDLHNNQWTNLSEQANGIDDDHNGLVDDLHGWDWVAASNQITDEQGHGTLMAGLIAAEGNNATGTTGVMWRAGLMSLRVLDRNGTGDVAKAVEAIDYAVDKGATIINCSWGTDEESLILKDAIQRAAVREVLVVCSAGNGARDIDGIPYYPASFDLPNLIAVAATDNFDQIISSSNLGAAHVAIAAPGAGLLTTQMGGGYGLTTGTSGAAALVSGVAGLVKTARPMLSAANTRAAIINGSRLVADLAGKVSSSGVVSAYGALGAIQGPDTQPSPTPSPITPTPEPTPTPGDGGDDTGGDGGSGDMEPSGTSGAPGANLPNLNDARNIEAIDPKAPAPIHSDAVCLTCDPEGAEPPLGSGPDPDFSMARLEPSNRTGRRGVDLGSRNFNWAMPLVSLQGRAGLDLGLTLYYNSLVWVKDDTTIRFNSDRGFPGPGFRLGLPVIQKKYHNNQVDVDAYMMVTPPGGRVELRRVAGTTNIYESADSSYVRLTDNGANGAVVHIPDGTQMTFVPSVNDQMRCAEIKDRNGNYISAVYQPATGRLTSITDTLGRKFTFAYTSTGDLGSIRQTRLTDSGASQTFTWATFAYNALTIQTNFPGLTVQGPQSSTINVPVQVGMADGSYYKFDYTTWGQVWRISRYADNDGLLTYTSYNLAQDASQAQSDCPRFTEQRVWAMDWKGDTDGVPAAAEEVVSTFNVAPNGSWTEMTMPDGTLYKELYPTSGWQKGLATRTEIWVNGVKKKWTSTAYTQDDETLAYPQNPRAEDASIYDESGNRRRTIITYHPTSMYSLPKDVKEYTNNGGALLRTTHREYVNYTAQHLIGLVSEETVYKGDISLGVVASKVQYQYDETVGGLLVNQGNPVQHDAAYGTAFTPRGNVTSVRRWDADAPQDATKVVESNLAYNTTGSVIFRRDPRLHKTTISYTDAYYNDTVNHNTLAYPTTVTDPEGYQSTTEYEYDTGQVVKTRVPSSGTGTAITYLEHQLTYDSAGRKTRITNLNNNAYVKWVYPTTMLLVQTYQSMEAGLGLAYSGKVLDGAGRVRATLSDLPDSTGLYRGQYITYDSMGRVSQQSNPTEMNANWVATGDDASGWRWVRQQYDWKGRPTIWTNQDLTTRTASYDGCGCAGGEQITVADERGRSRRMTQDGTGRLVKTEELNIDGTVYATTSYTYDVLDNLLTINQGGRTRTFDYDGHGRLQSRTTPEQGETTFTYNTDDTVNVERDARGTTTTYSYNNRHLVTGLTYTESAGVTATPNVTFTYDASAHRTSMTEAGFGKVIYNFNNLAQLTSEERTFNALTGSPFTFTYTYNLGGKLSSVLSSLGPQVGYTRDKIGRVAKVTGAGYAGVTNYIGSLDYRAFGALKAAGYGNTRALSVTYDTRMRTRQWNVAGVLGWLYSYNQFGENTGRVTYADSLTNPTLDRSYEYDQVGRLVEAHTGSEARAHINNTSTTLQDGLYSHEYYYDQWGNITNRRGWGGKNAGYDATFNVKNQMEKNPGNLATMQYDQAGNMTNDGWQQFTYDATGQQTTASYSGMTQWYDGDRLRVKKQEYGVTTYYLRSSVLGDQVLAELDANGQMKRGYVYLGGQMVALQDKDASGAEQVTWVHQDPLTKTQRFTSQTGALLADKVDLDPWGGESTAETEVEKQPHQFTTYERDKNGTDDAMNRRYNRFWSRFDQPDPWDGSYNLTNPQSFNRYAYTHNDPVNFIDPTGLMYTLICWWGGSGETGFSSFACTFIDIPEIFDGGDDIGGGIDGGTDDPMQPKPKPQQPCDVKIPTDKNDRAVVETLMGEATAEGASRYGLDQSGTAAYGNPIGTVTREDVEIEELLMVSVIENRAQDSGQSWFDVVNNKQTNGNYQFEGYPNGQQYLQNLGDNNSDACKRARGALSALDKVKQNGPVGNARNWRGIVQKNKKGNMFIRARQGAVRFAGTDFF